MGLVSIAEAAGPYKGAPEQFMLYRPFIGDWDFENEYYREDGATVKAEGEWHFAWALEGHAVADLWTYPRLSERSRDGAPPGGLGVTIRTFDQEKGIWNVAWSAANGRLLHLRARQVGEEIVQEGVEEDGRPVRWIFFDVRADSFSWRAETSLDGGASWRRTQLMLCHRQSGLHEVRATEQGGIA